MLRILIPLTEASLNNMKVRTHLARETYINKLIKYNILPVFATVSMTNLMLKDLEGFTSGLLLMGGFDIEPKNYHHERDKNIGVTNYRQDQLDLRLFREAYANRKPILGICRGHQLINVALGGTLHQHIPNFTTVLHDQSGAGAGYDSVSDVRHPAAILPYTKLHKIMNGLDYVSVTSGHHQAVDRLGDDLRVSALAPDGVIEAIEVKDPNRFCIGLQSHPEVDEESFFEPVFTAFTASVALYTAGETGFGL